MKMKKLITMITAGLLMAGCAEEVNNNRTDGDKRYITFSVSDDNTAARTPYASMRTSVAPWTDEQAGVEAKVVEVETDLPTEYPLSLTITDEPNISSAKADITRGALLNSGDAASLEFGVTEFLTSNATSPLFSNSKPAHQSTLDDGRELFKANEFWEYDSYDGISYDFYAYAPWVNGSGSGITLSNENRTITYDATGVAVNNQPDLMTARKWTSSYVGAIPLNFQHRLCAIQIKTTGTWAEGYHVSGVKFTNVISSGTFDIDTDKDDAWTSKGAADDYVVTGFTEADAANVEITGATGSNWLMLPPQTLSDAKLSITMSDGSGEYTITAPVNASTWRAGHTVTYTVSPEAITTMTVNYPTGTARSWQNGSTPVAGPVTTYTTTDQFGLFVLDKDNKIFISNQRITPTAGDAAASRTLDIPSLFKSKQFRYFLMYPYIDDASLEALVGTDNYNNYYKLDGTGRPANADAFFAEVIENWNPVNDQSTEATFKAQDLQIAKLSGDHFDMVHKMGLISITLPVLTVQKTMYYQISESEWVENLTKNNAPSNSVSATGATTITSSWKPWRNTSTSCHLISKPGSGTPIISARRGILEEITYSWTVDDLSITSTASCETKTISFPSTLCLMKTWEFSYEGSGRAFTIPATGYYCFECWGASGGYYASINVNPAGVGTAGYVKGIIHLSLSDEFFVFVGQRGFAGYTNLNATPITSFNGGGAGVRTNYFSGGFTSSSGGGATDIRTQKGLTDAEKTSWTTAWDNAYGLKGRIFVAAGGGGHGGHSSYGAAGGLNGYDSSNSTGSSGSLRGCTGATQTTGGTTTPGRASGSIAYTVGTNGTFGVGGKGGASNNVNCGGGGGGGYWGGAGGGSGNIGCGGVSGSGGSSYISGHKGCVAIVSAAGTSPKSGTANSIEIATHYSGLAFLEGHTEMIDGYGYSWTTSKGSQVNVPSTDFYGTTNRQEDTKGHVGNGFARITQIVTD